MKRINKIRIKYVLLVFFFIILAAVLPTFMRYQVSVTAKAVGYAKETRSSTYKVIFHSNGGEGIMDSMTIKYNETKRLPPNAFTIQGCSFVGWNTEENGSGTNYTDEQEINNTTYIDGDEINLYAMYSRAQYTHTGDIIFDGENGENPCINTGIYLFSEENINKDFEVSFEIKSRGSNSGYTNGEYPTIMSAIDERGNPWPGMAYRQFNETSDQIVVNETSSNSINKLYDLTNMQKVTLRRINGIIYLSTNDGPNVELLDVSSITPFDYPVMFGASLDANKNPQRWFQGTLSNLKIVVTEPNPEMGSIRYNANGGMGNNLLQNVLPDTTYKLIKNTYTREGYLFNGWNTKRDGSETSYADEQEVTNLVGAGQMLTLYAQWKKYNYTVEFDANGGTGSMNPQEFESGTAESLTPSTFEKAGYSFAFWNTAADGSGTSYEDQESVNNLGTEENQVITLYAMYEQFNYRIDGDIIFDETTNFDGKRYIDTHMYLFSRKNANKDFEISFEIKECININNYNTIVSSLDESGNPYPGFVFRIDDESADKYEFEANASTPREVNKNYTIAPQKVVIKRVNGILYLKLGDNEEEQIINYSTLSKNFYYPLTIGASLDMNFAEWRNFYGTISNLNITLSE